MHRTYDFSEFREYEVKEGEKTSCLIPLMPEVSFDLSVRSEKEVMVGMVTEDGQTIPMEIGKIVHLKGKNRNFAGIDVSTDTNFWYRCLLSRTDEMVDPTPVVVEMSQTQGDVIKNLIDERLRRYLHVMEINRELSEDEKDELLLDIARGDLEFEEIPDEFGLGYQERLEEFSRRAEQNKEAEAPASDTLPTGSKDDQVVPAAVSTVPST